MINIPLLKVEILSKLDMLLCFGMIPSWADAESSANRVADMQRAAKSQKAYVEASKVSS
jgi:hypothetical protein